MTTVLVVDDQPLPREHLRDELREAGMRVVEAGGGEEAWCALGRQPPDLVVTDLHMPGCDGIQLVERIRTQWDMPVIVLTGNGTIEGASRAFKAGADEFIHAPDIEPDALVRLILDAAGQARLDGPAEALAGQLVGRSEAIVQLRERVLGLAPLGTPVLVSGARGVGKRTIVRALHELGADATLPLTTLDAAHFAPPDAGGVPLPGRSSVHLREVESLSLAGQRYWAARLAKAEASAYRAAPRVFFTTSDLAELRARADRGEFDPGLAHVLLRFHLNVPSLEARAADLPEIAQDMARRLGATIGRPRVQLSAAALDFLAGCNLPGNLAQLEELIERAIAFSGSSVISRTALQPLLEEQAVSVAELRAQRRSREHAELLEALAETGGNITRVAEKLGRSRPTIYRMIERFQIPLDRAGRPQRLDTE